MTDIHKRIVRFDCASPSETSRARSTFIHGAAQNPGTPGTKVHNLDGVQNMAASHSRAIAQIIDMPRIVDVPFPGFLSNAVIEILLLEPLADECSRNSLERWSQLLGWPASSFLAS
jgi:hypothetical protein